MSETDVQRTEDAGGPAPAPPSPPPSGENPILNLVQKPRIVLLMLTIWSLLTVLTEAANENGLFMDLRIAELPDGEIDGALAGLGLAWQGLPLAVLYADSFRNPAAHKRIFWLALVHTGALIVANFYHLGKGDFSFESIILPVASAAVLFFLSFVQLFQESAPEPSGSTA